MGMPSASVQPGTQPQGKGFNQSINPPQSKQLDEMQAQTNASQMRTMDMPASSIYTVPQNQRPQQSQLTGKGAGSPAPQAQQPKSVEDLYSMYSDRGPDAEGLAYWKNQFGNNIDQNAINTFQSSVRDVWNKEGKPADYGVTKQPRMGQPNPYSNTIRPWDNASIQPQQSPKRGGKGKG
jgi:hypothetical protein